ncbi:MAG: archaellum operon transcriptional activator EarA family protein [Methanosarcinales archaeon]
MLGKAKKTGFGDVLVSIRKNRVRSEILMYLYNNYPETSYPAEIAKDTGIDKTNIIKGLRGAGRFDVAKSLLRQGVVEEMEQGNEAYYRLSERGKSMIESRQEA